MSSSSLSSSSPSPPCQDVAEWWPHRLPVYDIGLSYAENAARGPFMQGQSFPHRTFPPSSQWHSFLGHKIASPIGVPAGPLLNSAWTQNAADLGFDVVTYKTIRSSPHSGHSLPNMVYVSVPGDFDPTQVVESTGVLPLHMKDLAVTNSFGMPSRDRDFLREDIPRAIAGLHDGQLMIVSVVGSVAEGRGSSPSEAYDLFVKDFVDVATFAKECGALVVEANFSCPNVSTKESSIYQSPQAVKDIASSIVNALGSTPLVIKIGHYADKELMKDVFKAACEAKVAAIAGVNSVSMTVVDPVTKQSALGATRIKSGVCGGPIRNIALDFMHSARGIITKEQLPMELLGCGGITTADHFDQFLDAGANVAMSATGYMWDPLLAARFHHKHAKTE